MERLFGREITNLEEHAHSKNNHARRAKPALRSYSFAEEPKAPQRRETICPNVSLKPQRPSFTRDPPAEQGELREALTDYFEEAMGFMLAQEERTGAVAGRQRQG